MALPKYLNPTGAPTDESLNIDVSSADYVATGAQVAARGGVFLYIGGAGDVVIDSPVSGTGTVLKNLAAGQVYPFLVKKVSSAGTTATNLSVHW